MNIFDEIRPPGRVRAVVLPAIVFVVGIGVISVTGWLWLAAPLGGVLLALMVWHWVRTDEYVERRRREKRSLAWRGIADDSRAGVARRVAQARAADAARRESEAALREPGAATRARFLRPRDSTPFRTFAHEDAAAAQQGVPGSDAAVDGGSGAAGPAAGFGSSDPEIFGMPAPTTARLSAAPPDPELYGADAAARRRGRAQRAPRPVSSRDLGARFRYPIRFDVDGRPAREPDPDSPDDAPAPPDRDLT